MYPTSIGLSSCDSTQQTEHHNIIYSETVA